MAWENLTDIEKGYIAGFLDGEGSISMHNSGNCAYVTVSLYNTHLPTMNWLQEALGFAYFVRSEDSRTDSRNKKVNYAIQIRKTSEVISFLKNIEPYLKIKREQALLAIEYVDWQISRLHQVVSDEEVKFMQTTKKELSKLNRCSK